jgi:hypothetical protein
MADESAAVAISDQWGSRYLENPWEVRQKVDHYVPSQGPYPT